MKEPHSKNHMVYLEVYPQGKPESTMKESKFDNSDLGHYHPIATH